MNLFAALTYSNPFVVALIIIAIGALIYWFVGYMQGPNIFRQLVIGVVVVALIFFAITLLTGCGVTAHTPYGDFRYDQPARVSDGKTTLR